MAENLKSEASEWETGVSDPNDFTADAVVEALEDADDDEKQRVAEAEGEDGRSTVLKAANAEDEDEEEEEGNEPKSSEDDGVVDHSELDPVDEDYNPYQDPAVGSSSLADVIVQELAGDNGKSPTLEACRQAYKEANKG